MNMYRFTLVATICTAFFCACETPNLNEHHFACTTNSECGSGWQCDPILDYCVAALNNQDGVYDDRLVISAIAIQDPNQDLGKLGMLATEGFFSYFDQINKRGGIHGRRVDVDDRDDNYDPEITKEYVEDMILGENRKVFLLGSTIGTEPSIAAKKLAVENKVLFFGPATGVDEMEPNPPTRYVFNVRGRYSQEAETLAKVFMAGDLDSITSKVPPANIAALIPNAEDGSGADIPFGSSARSGVLKAVSSTGEVSSDDVQIGYYHGSDDLAEAAETVYAATAELLVWASSEERVEADDGTIPVGFVIATTRDAANIFISAVEIQINRAARGESLSSFAATELAAAYPDATERATAIERLGHVKPYIGSLSIVGTDLSDALKLQEPLPSPTGGEDIMVGTGVIIASPVPDAASDATGVIGYREALAAYNPDALPDPRSLEGYITARILGEALMEHGRDLTTESFIATLEKFNKDIGIGSNVSYSSDNHQAIHHIWGQILDSELNFAPLGLLSE